MNWTAVICVAGGGALGALSRWGLSLAAESLLGKHFPWGTLLANLIGCFLYGLLWSLLVERAALPPAAKFLLLTGFLGAFTTFSTYAFDTAEMAFREHAPGRVLLQLALHNGLGLLLVWTGLWVARG